jgi:predicted  nucleic acid-binding Zn-ribbon protein
VASPYLMAITAAIKVLPHAFDAVASVLGRDKKDKTAKAELNKLFTDLRTEFETIFDSFRKEFESLEQRVGKLEAQSEKLERKMVTLQRVVVASCVLTVGFIICIALMLAHIFR